MVWMDKLTIVVVAKFRNGKSFVFRSCTAVEGLMESGKQD